MSAVLCSDCNKPNVDLFSRFMKYIITSTDIRHNNPSLFQDCESFMDVLYGIQSGMSKKVSMEVTAKKSEFGCGKEVLPKDCLAVLEAAFKDFQAVICKMQGPGAITGDCLTKNERLLVLYYLEAVIMLKLVQRPGIVTHMTVSVCFSLHCLLCSYMLHQCAKLSVCRLRIGRGEAG